jgi:hypothetical protein
VVLALSWAECNGTGNWVFEMVVIISGLDDGQWYQGTDPTGAQTSLGLCQMPISMQDYSCASTEMAAGATLNTKNGTRKEETAPTASPIQLVGKQNNPRKKHKGVKFERQTERAASPVEIDHPVTIKRYIVVSKKKASFEGLRPRTARK